MSSQLKVETSHVGARKEAQADLRFAQSDGYWRGMTVKLCQEAFESVENIDQTLKEHDQSNAKCNVDKKP